MYEESTQDVWQIIIRASETPLASGHILPHVPRLMRIEL